MYEWLLTGSLWLTVDRKFTGWCGQGACSWHVCTRSPWWAKQTENGKFTHTLTPSSMQTASQRMDLSKLRYRNTEMPNQALNIRPYMPTLAKENDLFILTYLYCNFCFFILLLYNVFVYYSQMMQFCKSTKQIIVTWILVLNSVDPLVMTCENAVRQAWSIIC